PLTYPAPLLPHPFPYTTLFRSPVRDSRDAHSVELERGHDADARSRATDRPEEIRLLVGGDAMHRSICRDNLRGDQVVDREAVRRSEEHTSELQSRFDLVCRLQL